MHKGGCYVRLAAAAIVCQMLCASNCAAASPRGRHFPATPCPAAVGIRELIGNIAFLQPSDSLYRDVVKGRVVPQRQQDGEALVDLRQLQRELEQRGHWRSLQEGRATLVALERLQRHGAEQQRHLPGMQK